MRRPITGYHRDEAGDWIAELGCGHGQHVRHRPPFFSRPWTTSPEGRASMLGTELECVRCERLELPEGFAPYKRTPEFDETSLPAGLRARHATRPGTWAVIHVLEGRVRYVLEGMDGRVLLLDPATPGIVAPELPHHVEPEGPARLFVEFHRREEA